MTVATIHSYLVNPAKNEDDAPDVGGTQLPLNGKLFTMLDDVYSRAHNECNIDIAFNPRGDGTQANPVRDLILRYVKSPSLAKGRAIAKNLQQVTTKRSGLGLLFLISGKEGANHKLVVSRFPADNGIWAEQKKGELTVEFLERVFMKSATAYKSALYTGRSLKAGFWDGKCIDKQINSKLISISDYWIKDFLDSDFKTTPAQGSRRLALALREAIKSVGEISAKEEIGAAARLLASHSGKALTPDGIAKKFALSPPAVQALKDALPGKQYTEQFVMDTNEYTKYIAFKSVELDNGGILTAGSKDFESIFNREETENGTRFSTEGNIVSERLRRSKN